MDKDITWTIDGIEADWLEGSPPTLTRGAEVELNLAFVRRERTTTVVEAVGGFSYGTAGASYGNTRYGTSQTSTETTTKTDFDPDYSDLLEYLEFAGDETVRRGKTDRGVPWFRERLPSKASVDSLVVPIETGDDVEGTDGFWAIIVGGEDTSSPPTNARFVTITVFVLGDLDEWATREDVYADIGNQQILS